MPNSALLLFSDFVISPNCYHKEEQLIACIKVEENADINAVKPLDEV